MGTVCTVRVLSAGTHTYSIVTHLLTTPTTTMSAIKQNFHLESEAWINKNQHGAVRLLRLSLHVRILRSGRHRSARLRQEVPRSFCGGEGSRRETDRLSDHAGRAC